MALCSQARGTLAAARALHAGDTRHADRPCHPRSRARSVYWGGTTTVRRIRRSALERRHSDRVPVLECPYGGAATRLCGRNPSATFCILIGCGSPGRPITDVCRRLSSTAVPMNAGDSRCAGQQHVDRGDGDGMWRTGSPPHH